MIEHPQGVRSRDARAQKSLTIPVTTARSADDLAADKFPNDRYPTLRLALNTQPDGSSKHPPPSRRQEHRKQEHRKQENKQYSPSGLRAGSLAGSNPAGGTVNTAGEQTGQYTLEQPPAVKPRDARFSSGPCRKHPGWSVSALDTIHLGRSHRATAAKARLQEAIERASSLMQLPPDWKLGIVPGSDTGAFEMAIWSLLGDKPVTALVWESFSKDWANDLSELGINPLEVREASYGELPELEGIDNANDVVFVYNGTTSGVRLPNLDFISGSREGLVLCDATSALFSTPLDYTKLDVVTWSWQKVLGGEAAHGMLALSPAAQQRLQSPAPRALPKLFRLTSGGKLNEGIFSGATINTPSMLAVEDLHSALDWADSCGGCSGLIARSDANFRALDEWVRSSTWIDWLARVPETRSTTSMCFTIVGERFCALSPDAQKQTLKLMLSWLDKNAIAYDIGNYRSAPTGFRIWGGATIDSDDLTALTGWLDYVYTLFENNQLPGQNPENENV